VGYDFRLEDRDARVVPHRAGTSLELEIDGVVVRAALERGPGEGEFVLVVDGRREPLFLANQGDVHFLHWRGRTHRLEAWNALERVRAQSVRAGGVEEIRAPMPGVVVSIAAEVGRIVETGELLLTIESMKLQTAITASHPARVAEICVATGESFDQGKLLVRLEKPGEAGEPAAAAKTRKRRKA
jgi:acetyl/propionyl-CoA carboxylase alpha subunit